MIDFDAKVIHPMLIGASGDAFDSADYIYELKWDGERCIAYLDPKTGTELRNKRNLKCFLKYLSLLIYTSRLKPDVY
jgi:bifunctional non-homologous end joining protein LigD/DNA ligase-1